MKNSCLLLLPLWLFISCSTNEDRIAIWKQEIADTEKAFAELAKSEGIAKAFAAFAADDAVLLRNDKLINGKEAIKESYDKFSSDNVSLTWAPDFIEVSTSGDLGYTYGKYVYTAIDSAGIRQSQQGIFHTIWKRQQDGTWKFVWD